MDSILEFLNCASWFEVAVKFVAFYATYLGIGAMAGQMFGGGWFNGAKFAFLLFSLQYRPRLLFFKQ